MTFPLYKCPSLNGILPHVLFLQNLPSVVVGHVLNPQPGEVILDMCAAPGRHFKSWLLLPVRCTAFLGIIDYVPVTIY